MVLIKLEPMNQPKEEIEPRMARIFTDLDHLPKVRS
jgi:hypothetical protein